MSRRTRTLTTLVCALLLGVGATALAGRAPSSAAPSSAEEGAPDPVQLRADLRRAGLSAAERDRLLHELRPEERALLAERVQRGQAGGFHVVLIVALALLAAAALTVWMLTLTGHIHFRRQPHPTPPPPETAPPPPGRGAEELVPTSEGGPGDARN